MDDLISRLSELRSQYNCFDENEHGAYHTLSEAIEALNRASAQQKQKKGKWNTYYHGVNEDQVFTYSCNQCGYSAPYGLYGGKYSQKKWAYCPNCGADMREE